MPAIFQRHLQARISTELIEATVRSQLEDAFRDTQDEFFSNLGSRDGFRTDLMTASDDKNLISDLTTSPLHLQGTELPNTSAETSRPERQSSDLEPFYQLPPHKKQFYYRPELPGSRIWAPNPHSSLASIASCTSHQDSTSSSSNTMRTTNITDVTHNSLSSVTPDANNIAVVSEPHEKPLKCTSSATDVQEQSSVDCDPFPYQYSPTAEDISQIINDPAFDPVFLNSMNPDGSQEGTQWTEATREEESTTLVVLSTAMNWKLCTALLMWKRHSISRWISEHWLKGALIYLRN